jgi:DNA-binding NarL/FixJ family response regulator
MTEINQQYNSGAKKIRILLAEDRRLVREAWNFILKNDNRFSIIAESDCPESTLHQARDLKPDVIILEVKPPELSGIEMVSLVHKFSPASKILCLSFYTVPTIVHQVMKAGASGFLTKTSPQEELAYAITEINAGENYLCSEFKKTPWDRKGRSVPKGRLSDFSIRETEVFLGIKSGLDSWEMAEQLNIRELTVEMHRREIARKLKQYEDELQVELLNKN